MTTTVLELNVSGIICRACEDAIADALLHTRGVVSAQAHYWRGRVTITYDPNIVTEDTLRQELTNAGYPPGTHGMGGVVVDGICLALVGVLYSGLPKLLALVKVPALADNASLGLVFLVGLLTSTHCIGMCGGILLAQTTDARGVTARSKRGLIASAAYNGGRVVSYTAVGALCGALGAVMSGTGSAVFGIFADADSAAYAKRRLARDYAECFSFMGYAPIIFISAQTGYNVNKLMQLIRDVDSQNGARVPTGVLNEMLARATARMQPPSDKGRRLKIFYLTQASTRPPTFVAFVNSKQLFHFSYQRYLINQIRENFGLEHTPIRLVIRERGSGEVGAKDV